MVSSRSLNHQLLTFRKDFKDSTLDQENLYLMFFKAMFLRCIIALKMFDS